MAKLTKHQQKFWDLLRLPYLQNCSNCVYAPGGWGSGCKRPGTLQGYPENDIDCFDLGFRHNKGFPRWKWNGKDGQHKKYYYK